MKLYFIRHGQTEYNLEGKIQGGKIDSPLTEKGVAGAKQVGEKLKNISFTSLYTSPLHRTQETARYIIEDNPSINFSEVEILPNLSEMSFGKWEGRSVTELKELPEFYHLRNKPTEYNPTEFEGETYEEVQARMQQAFQQIISENQMESNVLVVSHGIALTTFLKNLMNIPLAKIREDGLLNNTSISIVEVTETGSKVLSYNG